MDRFYESRPGWRDGTAEFHNLVRKLTPDRSRVLELGPGTGGHTSRFLSEQFKVVDGLDVDPEARENKYLNKVIVYDGGRWPLEDNIYDAVVSDYVIEHLKNPHEAFSEAFRVLKPGGLFIFRTPNLFHYVALVAWLTPMWFHELVANRLRKLLADSHEPYPTFYRANTRGAVRKTFRKAGFSEMEILLIEKQPSYGMSSRVMFLLLMLYERIVNSTDKLAWARANIMAAYQKACSLCP